VSEEATQTFDRDGPWQKRIREECLAVRDAAGILDLPGFSRFRVQGDGARAWLSTLITGVVPKPGRIGLGYFADDQGPHRHRNVDHGAGRGLLLPDHRGGRRNGMILSGCESICRKGSAISLTDVTDGFACQILTGPNARAILADVTDADLTNPG
jgi:dimethylglycine dehydrogenase